MIVFREDPSGETWALTDVPPVNSMRVDQLLTSEHFGLYSTIDPSIDATFGRYLDLRDIERPTAEEAAELARIKAKLDQDRVLGEDRRERLMLEAIDRYLSQERQEQSEPARQRAREDTLGSLLEIWKTEVPTPIEPADAKWEGNELIRVARPHEPVELSDKAPLERAAAIRHFEVDKRKDTFKFTAYKAPGVSEALNAMFFGKCAYCESPIRAVHPTDVEHFRPKSAVMVGGKLTPPGYYWMAANWQNLLASCIFCNRPNRHDITALGRRTQGKGNHFPVEDENGRARHSSHDHNAERPHLLDPSGLTDPRNHLVFSADGWIDARIVDGAPSKLGSTSIDVYALRRPRLVDARAQHALRIAGELRLIEEACEEAKEDASVRYRQGVSLEKLASFLSDGMPYIAMARDVIEQRQPGLLSQLPALLERFRALSKSFAPPSQQITQVAPHLARAAGAVGPHPATMPPMGTSPARRSRTSRRTAPPARARRQPG